MGIKDLFKKKVASAPAATPDIAPEKSAHSPEYNIMFALYQVLMQKPTDDPYRLTHELLRRACRGKNMRFLYDCDEYEYVFYSPVLLRPVKIKNVDGRTVYVKIGDGVWAPFDGRSVTALRATMLVDNVCRQRYKDNLAVQAAIQAEIDAKRAAAIRELRDLYTHVCTRDTNRTR